MVCTKCGENNIDGARFCSKCGCNLEQKENGGFKKFGSAISRGVSAVSNTIDSSKEAFKEAQYRNTKIVFSTYESSRKIIKFFKYLSVFLGLGVFLFLYNELKCLHDSTVAFVTGGFAGGLVIILGFNFCNQMKVRYDISETLQYVAVHLLNIEKDLSSRKMKGEK